MEKNNSIAMGIGAMLALALSLPLEWMTIHDASMKLSGAFQNFGNIVPSSLRDMTLGVTGVNGNITVLTKVPIWFIVVVGIVGVLLAVFNRLRVTSFPKFVPLVPLLLSVLFVFRALIAAIGNSEVTVEIGIFVALIGLVLGYIHAMN